jgi:hypothetical protein
LLPDFRSKILIAFQLGQDHRHQKRIFRKAVFFTDEKKLSFVCFTQQKIRACT